MFLIDAARQVGTVPEQAAWEPGPLLPAAPWEHPPPWNGKVPSRTGGQRG